MPTGNISWSDMTPEEKAAWAKKRAQANSLGNPTEHKGITTPGMVPNPLKQKAGSTTNAFGGIKAYNTRANRSVYSK